MNLICEIILFINIIIITNGYVARERLTPNPGMCIQFI